MALREPFPGFPPPLTTRPEGLLSMLGLQTNGSYPQHLAYEQLLPSLDLLPWYLESRAEIQSASDVTVATSPNSFGALFTVPQQEVWVLLNCTLQASNISTPVTVQLARARSNDSLSRIALSAPAAYDTGIAGPQPLIPSLDSVRYLVFRPSVQIGIHGVTGTAGLNRYNCCLRFVRCTI